MTVVSATLADAGPGECRLTYSSRDAALAGAGGAHGRTAPSRCDASARGRSAPDAPTRWIWNGGDATGSARSPPASTSSAPPSPTPPATAPTRERTCWVGYLAGTPSIARPAPRDRVGVDLRTTTAAPRCPTSTPVSLTLRRRTGTPGSHRRRPSGRAGRPRAARGRAGSVRITLPPGINPASLWLVATTLDARTSALIAPRRRRMSETVRNVAAVGAAVGVVGLLAPLPAAAIRGAARRGSSPSPSPRG